MPLRGPIDRHRGRALEPVGIAERVLPADDAGRVKSEAALSKQPKGRGSRPITPQDEVSENDNRVKSILWVHGENPSRAAV